MNASAINTSGAIEVREPVALQPLVRPPPPTPPSTAIPASSSVLPPRGTTRTLILTSGPNHTPSWTSWNVSVITVSSETSGAVIMNVKRPSAPVV
jgi:hypothetical protein